MDNGEQKEKVTKYFDESKDWQGDVYQAENSFFTRVIKRRKLNAFEMINRLPELKRGKALDVGFGSGIYLEELLKMGFDCSGTDISSEMLETCRIRLQEDENASRVHLKIGDVEHIPFNDGEFDLVLCIGVLGYLLRDEMALAELKRVVKPGGYLLINLTNMYSLSDADYVLRKKWRSLFLPKPSGEQEADHPDYAIQNEWVMKNRKFQLKAYNLRKYQRLITYPNFTRVDAMTYGFEFRLLRRLKFVPTGFLESLELFLEKFFRKLQLPYYASLGWVYIGIYKRQS